MYDGGLLEGLLGFRIGVMIAVLKGRSFVLGLGVVKNICKGSYSYGSHMFQVEVADVVWSTGFGVLGISWYGEDQL